MFSNFVGCKLKVNWTTPNIYPEQVGCYSPSVSNRKCVALRNKGSVVFYLNAGGFYYFFQDLFIKLLNKTHFFLFELMIYILSTSKKYLVLTYNIIKIELES